MKRYYNKSTMTEISQRNGVGARFWIGIDWDEFCIVNSTDLWALYNATREKLEELYPGCIFPVPEDEVDADVMRAFSDMQEEYRSMLIDETE